MNRDTYTTSQVPRMRGKVGRCREGHSNVTYLHLRALCPNPEGCHGCRLCSLWLCRRCGGVEGTLTSGGCPGFRLTLDELDLVFELGLSAREAQELWSRESSLPG